MLELSEAKQNGSPPLCPVEWMSRRQLEIKSTSFAGHLCASWRSSMITMQQFYRDVTGLSNFRDLQGAFHVGGKFSSGD